MYVRFLPSDSATANVLRNGPDWTLEAHLLDDLRMAMTGSKEHPPKPHPSRPRPQAAVVHTRDQIAAHRRRQRERQLRLDAREEGT